MGGKEDKAKPVKVKPIRVKTDERDEVYKAQAAQIRRERKDTKNGKSQ